MKDIVKKYTNGEVTIVWKPGLCEHSTICWKGATGLIDVFNPSKKPWINAQGASTEKIIEQVKRCPSGALSYFLNNETQKEEETQDERNTDTIVEVIPNGPLRVHGCLVIKDMMGNEIQKENITSFCRCGGSNNKPFCDGTHKKNGFKD